PFERAAVNGFGTFFRAGGYSLHGSLYSSRTRYGLSRASMLGVRRNFFQRIDASLDYLRSVPAAGEPTATYVATFREQVSPRWSFNQVVTRGPGQTSYAFGGFFFSNRLTAGVEYQTIFQPFSRAGESAFRQVLLVTLKLQLPGGIELNAASDVSPAGKVRYTTYATTYAYRGVAPSGGGASIPSGAFYDYVVRGRVVDEAGQPVRGAALRLENDVVFTDSQGRFLHRVKKARELALAVALEDFMLPGRYVVLSAPATVKAAKEESAPLYDVVLRRVAAPAPKNVEKPAAPPRKRSDNRSVEEEIAKESVLGVPETKNGTPTTSGPFPLASSTQKITMMDARPVVAGGAPEKRNGNAQAQPWVSRGVRHYRAADIPVRDGANAAPTQQQREQRGADGAHSAQRAPAQRRPAAAGAASRNASGESAGGRTAARKPVDLREWAERLRPRTPSRPAGQ
ncbi:MAG TPA: carboxypeptidase-like regulatory domain-containing protein, partial [Candidatus Nitrosotenuis sp.]|nr:carboxypeptidase-like regulatory domain-containing protein [Candidatus Nitrosotenuis sp.]